MGSAGDLLALLFVGKEHRHINLQRTISARRMPLPTSAPPLPPPT
jgi:hypothetical protein